MANQDNQQTPNNPKNQLLRLVVGIVIVVLGIVIFQWTGKLYKEAEARDAQKKAEREEMIREIVEPDSVQSFDEDDGK